MNYIAQNEVYIYGVGEVLGIPGESINISNEVQECLQQNSKDKKSLKFMAKQDQLALLAANRAMNASNLIGKVQSLNQSDVGIYLTVGVLPFEKDQIHSLAINSILDKKFSPDLFSGKALPNINPLLTFKCLPNMPLFHISYNLNIYGRYYITYPEIGQAVKTLDRAVQDIRSRKIQCALVGAVADRNNFLVEQYRTKFGETGCPQDAACFFLLSNEKFIKDSKPLGKVKNIQLSYNASQSNLENFIDYSKRSKFKSSAGPVDLFLEINQSLKTNRSFESSFSGADGSSGLVAIETLGGAI